MTDKKRNAIRCRHCGEVIESLYRHDFVTHSCEKMQAVSGPDAIIFVDGGQDYRRVGGNRTDWEVV